MLESLLIANRGEIARRIIRTCRRLGIRTVAVYSDADAGAPFVREADEAVAIGPSPAAESYLVGAKILEAARQTGAQAIHPGYGFLSENAEFAEAVMAAGLIWVGPPPSAIRAMGLKDAAKALMAKAGVPVTPGYLGEDQSDARLAAEAGKIGWPLLIKAVAGGGGKGMRRVDAAEDFHAALVSCRREAKASFGDDRVLLETYAARPRHIEVQIFADTQGDVVHLPLALRQLLLVTAAGGHRVEVRVAVRLRHEPDAPAAIEPARLAQRRSIHPRAVAQRVERGERALCAHRVDVARLPVEARGEHECLRAIVVPAIHLREARRVDGVAREEREPDGLAARDRDVRDAAAILHVAHLLPRFLLLRVPALRDEVRDLGGALFLAGRNRRREQERVSRG